jgi:hypothetical protein
MVRPSSLRRWKEQVRSKRCYQGDDDDDGDKGSSILRNVRTCLSDCTATHPTKLVFVVTAYETSMPRTGQLNSFCDSNRRLLGYEARPLSFIQRRSGCSCPVWLNCAKRFRSPFDSCLWTLDSIFCREHHELRKAVSFPIWLMFMDTRFNIL